MEYPANATFYVRLSLMVPKEGMRDRVLDLHRKLVDWLQGQPGFIRGFLMVEGDPEERVGHLNIYDSEQQANQVAQSQHVLSVRSELKLLIEEDTQLEISWTAYDPQLAKKATA